MRFNTISCLTVFALAGPLLSAQSFTVTTPTDLGTLGGNRSQATALNLKGTIVGSSALADGSTHAFRGRRSVLRDLGSLPGGRNSSAAAISEEGTVVGTSDRTASDGGGTPHAFLYRLGTLQDLGTLGGSQSRATGVNVFNLAVGFSLTKGDLANHAFWWNPETETLNDLGTFGGTESMAYGINSLGVVAGSSQTGQFDAAHAPITHAVSWNIVGGRKTDLGTLGGSSAQAFALNNFGVFAGASAITGNTATHAFLSESGSMTDLGTLGGTYSQATAVNDLGFVVGFSNIAGNRASHAFVWSRRAGMVDLNTLLPLGSGWVLTSATGINDFGKIVGVGVLSGNERAYVLSLRSNGQAVSTEEH